MDFFKNFARGTVSTTYDASATSVVMTTGHAARFPSVPFNAVWWDYTTYGDDPTDDPNREIVRVTGISSDTFTMLRGQEGTSASTKNTSGKTYKIAAPLTAKTANLPNPRAGIFIVDHFLNANGDTAWVLTTSGTGSPGLNGGSIQLEANHQGVTRLKTGTTTTGLAVITKNITGLYFGGGEWFCEWMVYIGTVPDATDDFVLRVGFGDSTSSATDHTDGLYFEIDRSQSANWRTKTASNSSRTATNSSTAWAVGWWRLGILLNAAANSCEFYINGTLVRTETATIPAAVTRMTSPSCYINKTAGTSERAVNIDYFLLTNEFTTPL